MFAKKYHSNILNILLTFTILNNLISDAKSKEYVKDKIVIVTGANRGLGFETTKYLASKGARVIMACRNVTKAASAKQEILSKYPKARLIIQKCDLNSFKSIRKFCAKFMAQEPRLDILVNNAGTAEGYKYLTEDGFEYDFQTNQLGQFLMTNILLEKMKGSRGRIVIVSSIVYILVPFVEYDNLNSEKNFDPVQAYCRTKLFNIYFMRELHRRFSAEPDFANVTVNALHPGLVNTSIWYRGFMALPINNVLAQVITPFFLNQKEGAETSIYLCNSREVEGISGEYWASSKVIQTLPLASSMDDALKIYEISEKLVKFREDEYHI